STQKKNAKIKKKKQKRLTPAKKKIARKPMVFELICKKCIDSMKTYVGESMYPLKIVESRLKSEVRCGKSKRKVVQHFRTATCGIDDMMFSEEEYITNTDERVNTKLRRIKKLNSTIKGLNSVIPKARPYRHQRFRPVRKLDKQQDIRNFFKSKPKRTRDAM
ncbi:hypothetical protein BgiBS90_019128, partial [Biomphalaria glabrata]